MLIEVPAGVKNIVRESGRACCRKREDEKLRLPKHHLRFCANVQLGNVAPVVFEYLPQAPVSIPAIGSRSDRTLLNVITAAVRWARSEIFALRTGEV